MADHQSRATRLKGLTMETELLLQIIAGGTTSTLAVALLAWLRCEKNHKETRRMLEKFIDKVSKLD